MNYCQFRNETIKRMCNSVGGGLPSIYQAVEYLGCSGTQFINTGIKTANGISANVKFARTDPTILFDGSRNNVILGARTSSNSRFFILALSSSTSNKNYGYGYIDTFGNTGHAWTLNEVTEFNSEFGANQIVITKEGTGGWTYTTNISTQYSASLDLYLCACNDGNTGYINPLRGNIYYCKITKNWNIVRDFIPCYRKSDNKPGMYDLVTNTFFTNSGTGEFTVGNNV